MRMLQRWVATVSFAVLGLAGSAHAAIEASLEFVEPTGTLRADEDMEVWLRLSLAASSDPLVFSPPFDPAFLDAPLPTSGSGFDGVSFFNADFVSYDAAYTNTYLTCSGSLGCGSAEYSFFFHATDQPGRPSFNFDDSINLLPGQSIEFLFGTYKPKAGGAAPGTYGFFSAGATVYVSGRDALDRPLNAEWLVLAETCSSGDPSCGFTRTVTAVPEAGTLGMMLAGLCAMTLLSRQRQRQS